MEGSRNVRRRAGGHAAADASGPLALGAPPCAAGRKIWHRRCQVIRIGRRAVASAMAIGAVLPMAGCGVLGSGEGDQTLAVMTVTSGAFTQDVIPAGYTCAAGAKAVSPPLGWAGAPAGTKSLAVVVDDTNSPITPYVYWIVFDINPATSNILQGQLPPGSRQARNSRGSAGYDPPCPGPQGHAYRFTVYALDKVLRLPAGAPLRSAWAQIAAATIGMGRMTPTAGVAVPATAPAADPSSTAAVASGGAGAVARTGAVAAAAAGTAAAG